MHPKVLIIGIDGGTFKLITPWVKEGKLPTITELMRGGVHGILKSTIPPVTSPAWQSFMTGCNPGKHGIFCFWDEKGRICTSKDLKKPPFWELIGIEGYKSIIIGVPCTWPPKPFNGIIVTGQPVPEGKPYTYPPSIQKEISSMGYIIGSSSQLIRALATSKKAREELIEIERKKTECLIYLAKKYSWNLICIVYKAPDQIQHVLYDKKHIIFEVYEQIDNLIRQLINTLKPEYVFIVSDHGFNEYNKVININKYLIDRGYLVRVKENSKPAGRPNSEKVGMSWTRSVLSLVGMDQEKLIRITPKFLLDAIRKFIPYGIRQQLIEKPVYKIDYEKSLAYCIAGTDFGIRINRNKFYSKMDYDAFRDKLIKELMSIKDPKTGKCVFKWIKHAEEVYAGEFTNQAPDLIYSANNGYYPRTQLWGKSTIETSKTFAHDPDGIFIAHGEGIKENYKLEFDINILDIAPTILYLFDLPIPNYMDGKVLTSILSPQAEVAHKAVIYVNPSYYEIKRLKSKIRSLKSTGRLI